MIDDTLPRSSHAKNCGLIQGRDLVLLQIVRRLFLSKMDIRHGIDHSHVRQRIDLLVRHVVILKIFWGEIWYQSGENP